MITGLQITGVLFALMMIYFAILHYKKNNLNGVEIVSWISIWILVILIMLFPEIVRIYASSFAISRLLDLLIGGAFIILFIMVSSAYVKVNKIEKKMDDLVRKIALEYKSKKNK